jgi:hypothetical protein
MYPVLFIALICGTLGAKATVWSHTEPIDIYESVSLSQNFIVAGTGSNYPTGAAVQIYDSTVPRFTKFLTSPQQKPKPCKSRSPVPIQWEQLEKMCLPTSLPVQVGTPKYLLDGL